MLCVCAHKRGIKCVHVSFVSFVLINVFHPLFIFRDRLTKSDFREPVNIGSDEMVSMNEMAVIVFSFENKKLPIHQSSHSWARGCPWTQLRQHNYYREAWLGSNIEIEGKLVAIKMWTNFEYTYSVTNNDSSLEAYRNVIKAKKTCPN